MMKRLLLIATMLATVFPIWGQNTKKMNSIKRNPLYLYAEATMETAAEAYDVANDLLLIQVKEYTDSKKAFRDKDVLIRDIQGHQDSLQIRRGEMVKVFLYVKKSNILDVENVTLVGKKSTAEKTETLDAEKTEKVTSTTATETVTEAEPATVPEAAPDPDPITVPAEREAAVEDPSLKLEAAWQQEVVDQLISAESFYKARSVLSRLKSEFKIKKTGPMAACKNPEEVFLLIGKDSAVVTVLGPGSTSRTDFKSLSKTTDNYNGYDKVWFIFSK